MGIRYRLDDLGWFQFEELMQALLKAELGIGVESWGGHSDHGRDAYSRGPLNFPAKGITSDGPFVFQAKFVENANAVGSDCRSRLIQAARQEAASIVGRSKQGLWKTPRQYALYTNAPLSPNLRDEIGATFLPAMPQTTVTTCGGNDICDLLDNNSVLRKSFPQLLSLRDLNQLLLDVVNKETLERSRAAILVGGDVVPTFVPTVPYNRAWAVLAKHHFCVLEGPPEMGKTAIAWMIALAQLSQTWDAIVCDHADDFFRVFDSGKSQVFIADDAFGSTEYDPSRGSEWERQIHRIYRFLDPRHWLVWTSRRHILERARREMDLQGEAANFPNPAAVLVNTSQLSEREKALILYRHAKAEALDCEAKRIVKEHAALIVRDPSFTPERIRRFVATSLHSLVDDSKNGKLTPDKLRSEVQDAIRNTTERTRKSFRALGNAQKWFLISVLEAGYSRREQEVNSLYLTHCPDVDRRPFEEVFDELLEAFIKRAGSPQWPTIDWVHPSYRDLVIEELVNTPTLKRRFLEHMCTGGIKLALSDTGGAAGTRKLPLMGSEEDWEIVDARAVEIVAGNDEDVIQVLNSLESAASEADSNVRERISKIVGSVCSAIWSKWQGKADRLSRYELESYFDVSLVATPLPPAPPLDLSWKSALSELEQALSQSEEMSFVLEVNVVEEWAELCALISQNEPRYLKQQGFPEKYRPLLGRVVAQAKGELQGDPILDDSEALSGEAQRLQTLSDTLGGLAEMFKNESEELQALASALEAKSTGLMERAEEEGTKEEGEAEEDSLRSSSVFDVQSLFSDL